MRMRYTSRNVELETMKRAKTQFMMTGQGISMLLQTYGDSTEGRALNSFFKMHQPSFVRSTMKEALLEADLTEKQTCDVVKACKNSAEFAKVNGKLFEGFTE